MKKLKSEYFTWDKFQIRTIINTISTINTGLKRSVQGAKATAEFIAESATHRERNTAGSARARLNTELGRGIRRNPLRRVAKYANSIYCVSTFRRQLVPASDIRRGEVDFPQKKTTGRQAEAAVDDAAQRGIRAGSVFFPSFLHPGGQNGSENGGGEEVTRARARHPRRSDSAARELSVVGLI